MTPAPVRVHFDDQIVMHQHRGGVSRYTVELVRGLRDDPSLGVAVDFDWHRSTNEHALAAGLGRANAPWRRGLDALAARLPRPPRRIDIVHPTWYFPKRIPPRDGPPIVVTVFDMIPELMPEHWPRGNPHLAKDAYVRAATAICCISESTERDLRARYPRLDASTHVTHLGVGPEFRPGLPRPPGLPRDYLLFVGNRERYKDFGVALEAFAGIRSEHRSLRLVAVFGRGFTEAETADIARRGLTDAVDFYDASDTALPGVFANALVFLFPSRYEGFGLPTLEAMASGTPVVLANSSSHPEVGGDVARYFPPGDAAALGQEVLRILDDTRLRADLAARGVARAKTFSWHRTAEQTSQVYRAVLAAGKPGAG